MRATTSSLVGFASCQALATSQLELISVAGWWSGGAARGSLEKPKPDSRETRRGRGLFGHAFLCSRYVTVARLPVDASCSWAGERQ